MINEISHVLFHSKTEIQYASYIYSSCQLSQVMFPLPGASHGQWPSCRRWSGRHIARLREPFSDVVLMNLSSDYYPFLLFVHSPLVQTLEETPFFLTPFFLLVLILHPRTFLLTGPLPSLTSWRVGGVLKGSVSYPLPLSLFLIYLELVSILYHFNSMLMDHKSVSLGIHSTLGVNWIQQALKWTL